MEDIIGAHEHTAEEIEEALEHDVVDEILHDAEEAVRRRLGEEL